ncbi:MAG TPA: ATP-binding protein, partial [Terracidiphilus sp.]|nr:ATP-binding protein [Terracidiphilus sp.]
IVDAVLVDVFLTKSEFRFSIGFAAQEERLAVFLVLSTLVGVLIRRLADQRTEMDNQELKKSLILEVAQRQMAEERIRAAEVLRERDAVLQIALQANGMGLWVWDLAKNTMHRSDEVFRMAGREPGTFDSRLDVWLDFVHPDDRDGLVKAIEHTRDAGVDYHHQYRVIWPDGSIHWIESQGKRQRDTEGKIVRIVGVMADITHRKRTEEAMLRAEKLAVAGRLAASVAHEINNPLEAVTNLLYLISLTDNPEETHKYSQRALDEVLRVSLITQSTLKFHRQPGTPRIAMLSEVMEGVVAMFRGRMTAAGVHLDTRMGSEVAIACMSSEVQQIFANLIANAIEAMPYSGRLVIRMRPSIDWRDRTRHGMRITFCDTGTGMDRATMKRIFEPFFTTKIETGTGLGMWVVSQLVERHGGRINVWSTQRSGATGTAFSIFLPVGIEPGIEGVEIGASTGRSLPAQPVALAPALAQNRSSAPV